ASSIQRTRVPSSRSASRRPQTLRCRPRASASSACSADQKGDDMPETIVIERAKNVARVRMNRPEVRNALDGRMIVELTDAFVALANEDSVRAVVLEGAGTMFSGGADVNYMRASLELSE